MIGRFLEPSFTAARGDMPPGGGVGEPEGRRAAGDIQATQRGQGAAEQPGESVSTVTELGLMGVSVMIALIGIVLAHKVYAARPASPDQLATWAPGVHRLLLNKYYVDELYGATVISGTFAGARALWTVDRTVVDGAVNAWGRVTLVSSWLSGLTDRAVVDGVVNLVGWIVQESSHAFRRVQTGLVQNYALLMLFGIFAFVSVYLFVRQP
jgi:NADH-quinone oxidoreductase subunit L